MFDCISFVSYMTYSSIRGNQHESIGNQVISNFKILLERPKVNNCQTLNFGNFTDNLRFLAFDNVEFDSGTFFFAHTIMNKHNALHAMLEIIIYSVLKAG